MIRFTIIVSEQPSRFALAMNDIKVNEVSLKKHVWKILECVLQIGEHVLLYCILFCELFQEQFVQDSLPSR
jgi:hypothetical protein